jgi:hypothetical protein
LWDVFLFKKDVDSEEVDIRIDECERYDDSATTANDSDGIIESDANLQNSLLFDLMYGDSSSSESEDGSNYVRRIVSKLPGRPIHQSWFFATLKLQHHTAQMARQRSHHRTHTQ